MGQIFRKGREEWKIRAKTSTGWSSSHHGERVDDRRDQRNGRRAGVMKMEMKKKRVRGGQGYRLRCLGRVER